MKRLSDSFKCLLVGVSACMIILLCAAWWLYDGGSSFEAVETVPITRGEGAPPKAGDTVKIMSWNVQYFAGKSYLFFYDVPDFAGPHLRPSPKEISKTLAEVARVVADENPDILMLQEVDEGAGRTDGGNQTEALQGALETPYPFVAETFYWKARYVPHPKIMGPVGMKLVILSKFPMEDALRIALPQANKDPLTQRLDLQRCLLSANVPVTGGTPLSLINLHLEAFPKSPDLLTRQLNSVAGAMTTAIAKGEVAIAAGDFNLLPPGQFDSLSVAQRAFYRPESEMTPLFKRYHVVPGIPESNPENPSPWFTHFPNDPDSSAPDRTIDYIVLSPTAKIVEKRVRRKDTLHISDHLPVVVTIQVN